MAEIAGLIASAVGKHIVCKLAELVKDEIDLLWGFKDEVEGMREKMQELDALMQDADDKMRHGQNEGKAVALWLAKFKSVAYDVEDVLDDLDATALIHKTQSKVKLFFSGNNHLLQRWMIAHNMKNIKEKIEEIQKKGQTLSLVRHEAMIQGSRNMETFATSSSEGMVGRDTEKEKIINLLLKSEANEDISVIPIIGLGGLGKSTLAESVFADQRVNVFDVKVWVHVSELFDLHKIGSAIMERINGNINLENCSKQFLHDNLKKELATTRYLIVLDDLWEDDVEKLEELKRMLKYGCKGSKIVVTTRNKSVVENLSTGIRKISPVSESDQINLDFLSPSDCWEVMKQRALGPDDDDQRLQEIGRQIAAKCGGLPLVANALGQVMFGVRKVKAWENIRDIKVDLGLTEAHQNKALERLMLSYYYMKMEFKLCFTYLASLPKGFLMEEQRLIQQWTALGYIHAEDDGERCINYLLGMSFLHISRSSLAISGPVHSGSPRYLTMHDLVHDLALIIASNESLVVDANAPGPRIWDRARYCRHAQLINYHNQSKIFKELPSRVRSLHFNSSGKLQLPKMAFSRSKHLRVLDLNVHSVSGKSTLGNLDHGGGLVEGQATPGKRVLLSSIHQSKLLRYLDATALPITSLPKSFHTLQYMQTLILSKCSLQTLPSNISSLDQLCYFDLSGNTSLEELPVSFGKLSKLFFLNLSGCSMLKQLPESIYDLACLQHLDMSECHAIEKLPDKHGTLSQLIFLDLSGCSKMTKLPSNLKLESLEHLNLSNCHELENLPEDFGKLQNLVFLNLSDCYKVSFLPETVCQLIRLKLLDLSDCHSLRELPDCFGNLVELHSLNMTSCSKLQLLPESFCQLFKLKHLNLSYCTRLKELPSSLGRLGLESLDISSANFHELPDSIHGMTTLTQFVVTSARDEVFDKARDIRNHLNLPKEVVHKVHQIEDTGCSSIVELAQLTCCELRVVGLQNVKHPEDAEKVKLRDKSGIRMLSLTWGPQRVDGKYVLERLIPPRTLEHFYLRGYLSKDFPNWMSDISTYLPSLNYLNLSCIRTCDYLPPFGQLPNLRCLYLRNIRKVRKIGKEFYGEGGTCRKLRSIHLESMPNLEEWWTTQSGEDNEEFLIPNLHDLTLADCPMLKFLPHPPKSMFWVLENSNMVLPKEGFGKLSSSAPPFCMVVVNCNFSLDKWDRLQYLPTLEILEVRTCSGLTALPEVIGRLTSLTSLCLRSLKDMEKLPESLGNLTSLEHFCLEDCPFVTSLPETIKNLTALRELWLRNCNGLYVLPERLGQLISLEEFYIVRCPNLTSLPESIRNLTALKELYIWCCPSLLERYQGEDAHMISHIPSVTLNEEPWEETE